MNGKKFWIPVLWAALLIIGIYAMIQVWNNPDISLWLDVILRLPLMVAAIWAFRLIYDIWISTEPFGPQPKFTEAPSVKLDVGGLIEINGEVYRFVEISRAAGFNQTTARIVLEGIPQKHLFVH